jgi:pyridoxal phosphate enzyme (YggS family)
MNEHDLAKRVQAVKTEIPPHVLLVAAAKTRSPAEVRTAIASGITAIGYNYVQEAEMIRHELAEWEKREAPHRVQWHCIGHLQRNKAKKAIDLFDMIETIDSLRIAEVVNSRCAAVGKVIPVLIEVNSGRESNKTGVSPDEVKSLVRQVAELPHIRIEGLMTMGPRFGDPEEARPYFRLTKKLFDQLESENIPCTEMRYLSMGMSNSYKQAIEEGANIVRIGSKLFGTRN